MRKIALAWILGLTLAAIIAHFHRDAIEAHDLTQTLLFGRDAFGRDCISLLLVAAFESARAILPIGLICLLSSFGVALIISISNRDFAPKVFLDTLSSLPGFLLALALSVFFPNTQTVLLLGSFFMIFPWLTRFLESHLRSLKTKDFVEASRALGAKKDAIFFTHLFPELFNILISVLPYLLTRLLLLETSLTFIGLGKISDHETWGRLIYQGRDYLTEAPWILAICGIPLCITLFSLHLITHNDRL